jgi:protein pelota
VTQRKRYVKLVESVKENNGVVKIFSSMHVSGEQLGQLSGIAAILRFPMPEIEEDDAEGGNGDVSD